LVEKEHPRMRNERAGDLEPTPLAAAVAVGGPVDQIGEAEGACELVDPRDGLVRLDAPEPGVDLEIPAAAQGAVDNRLLKDEAADSPRGKPLPRERRNHPAA